MITCYTCGEKNHKSTIMSRVVVSETNEENSVQVRENDDDNTIVSDKFINDLAASTSVDSRSSFTSATDDDEATEYTIVAQVNETTICEKDSKENDPNFATRAQLPEEKRSSKRRLIQHFFEGYVSHLCRNNEISLDPITVKEALSRYDGNNWKLAMRQEMAAH